MEMTFYMNNAHNFFSKAVHIQETVEAVSVL